MTFPLITASAEITVTGALWPRADKPPYLDEFRPEVLPEASTVEEPLGRAEVLPEVAAEDLVAEDTSPEGLVAVLLSTGLDDVFVEDFSAVLFPESG